jgi:hypothetical protein
LFLNLTKSCEICQEDCVYIEENMIFMNENYKLNNTLRLRSNSFEEKLLLNSFNPMVINYNSSKRVQLSSSSHQNLLLIFSNFDRNSVDIFKSFLNLAMKSKMKQEMIHFYYYNMY